VANCVTAFLMLTNKCLGSEGSGMMTKPGPWGRGPTLSLYLQGHAIGKYMTCLWHSHPLWGRDHDSTCSVGML
jgi:hypothetical protein